MPRLQLALEMATLESDLPEIRAQAGAGAERRDARGVERVAPRRGFGMNALEIRADRGDRIARRAEALELGMMPVA